MNVSSWLKQAKTRIDTLDAELILLNVLGEKDRSYLALHEDRILTAEEMEKAETDIQKREKDVPLAYIVGYKEFYKRDFLVNESVLVPRGESEEIINIVLRLYRDKKLGENPRILDVGTGSGCLAISMALEMANAEVTGVDISDAALEVAKKNADKLAARVKFGKSNLLEGVREEKYDVIVANLPYVDENWDFLSPELRWEPDEALYAQNKGLEVIFQMIDEVSERKNTKYLVMESDVSQQEEIGKYVEEKGLEVVEISGYGMVIWVR